jgi:DNA-binding response OmpR family regulator
LAPLETARCYGNVTVAIAETEENSGLPFVPIVLVTAKADSKDVVAGLEAGADGMGPT